MTTASATALRCGGTCGKEMATQYILMVSIERSDDNDKNNDNNNVNNNNNNNHNSNGNGIKIW